MRPARLLPLALAALAAAAPARAAAADADAGHRRLIDLEFHPLFSIPDAIGVCLEGFPMRSGLSIEGCASIQVFEAAALNLALIYRFPLTASPTFGLSLGPAVGSHAIADSVHGPWIDVSADGFLSFEAVWWGERTGFQAQLGGGVMRMVWDRPQGINETWVPIVDLTLGIAFRTKGVGTPVPARYFGR